MLIAGVDEAGRGPLAGPVVAGAVILNAQHSIKGIKDSKKLTIKRREILDLQIRQQALSWGIGVASEKEIDQYNILNATLLAMKRAVAALAILPECVFVDGTQSPTLDIPTRTIIKGDQLVACIGAASILAKVFRDRHMDALHNQYPEYGFAQHKGYGTRQHLTALAHYGCSPVHRYSFAPVKKIAQKTAIELL